MYPSSLAHCIFSMHGPESCILYLYLSTIHTIFGTLHFQYAWSWKLYLYLYLSTIHVSTYLHFMVTCLVPPHQQIVATLTREQHTRSCKISIVARSVKCGNPHPYNWIWPVLSVLIITMTTIYSTSTLLLLHYYCYHIQYSWNSNKWTPYQLRNLS